MDQVEQRQLVFDLIDRYNEMLRLTDQRHTGFHYVNLRPLIDPDRDWANELHLRNSAYARAAARFHETIQSVVG